MTRTLGLRSFARAGALAILAAACLPAEEAPHRMVISLSRVKPDMVNEWEVLQKEASAAYQKAGITFRGVWQTAFFGDSTLWVAVAPITRMAVFDGANPFPKAIGEAAYARLSERARKCLIESRSEVALERPDLSIMTDEKMTPKIAMVLTFSVFPGKQRDYEAMVKSDILPALKKAEVKESWLSQTMLGGNTNNYTVVVPLANMAALDSPPPFVRALGVEGAATLSAKSAGIVQSVEMMLMRFRPDLSYMGSSSPSN